MGVLLEVPTTNVSQPEQEAGKTAEVAESVAKAAKPSPAEQKGGQAGGGGKKKKKGKR